jgi:hypothetical protein
MLGAMRALLILGSILLIATAVAQQREQLPSVLDLECAASGEKIFEENIIVGSALTQSQASRYDPRTNRCYVELIVQAADKPTDYQHRVLYDGQTNGMLAFAEIHNGKKGGKVFDQQHRTTNLDNAGWDDASEYIDQMMAEDRK